jgi:hypothetical protein
MTRRPISVTLVGWVFVLAGAVGIAYHARDLVGPEFQGGTIWVLLLRLAAIVAGFFILRGANWARVLAIAWMAYHVVLSAFHTVSELVVHVAFLTLIVAVLLRPAAAAFFRRSEDNPASPA